jgi:hypothetical protein
MTRYALAWIVATAAAVVGVAALLRAVDDRPARLDVAIERASCRLEPARDRPARPGAGQVVVRYRARLSAAESARLQRIVEQLAGRAITVPVRPAAPDVVEATDDARRLSCARLDQRTEDALILFARSADESP